MRKNSASRKKHFKSFLPLRNILKIKKNTAQGHKPFAGAAKEPHA